MYDPDDELFEEGWMNGHKVYIGVVIINYSRIRILDSKDGRKGRFLAVARVLLLLRAAARMLLGGPLGQKLKEQVNEK